MSRQRKAHLITLALLALALAAVVLRQTGFRPRLAPSEARAPAPQDAVYQMLEAARQGDVSRYLEAHTGQMEAALRAAISEKTERGFAAYLRELHRPIKGVAITEPQPVGEREVRLRVEYVYQDRNEAQTMYLEKLGRTWKIARVDAAERIPTVIPYGTPVQ